MPVNDVIRNQLFITFFSFFLSRNASPAHIAQQLSTCRKRKLSKLTSQPSSKCYSLFCFRLLGNRTAHADCSLAVQRWLSF